MERQVKEADTDRKEAVRKEREKWEHELECQVGDLEKELEARKKESEWWQRETESDVRVVELEREKEEVEVRLAYVEEKLKKHLVHLFEMDLFE